MPFGTEEGKGAAVTTFVALLVRGINELHRWSWRDYFGFLGYYHDEIEHVAFVPATDPAHALPIDMVSERDELTEANEFCLEFHLGHRFSDIHGSEPRNCQLPPRAEAVAVPGLSAASLMSGASIGVEMKCLGCDSGSLLANNCLCSVDWV
jgi:hypothetical protein